MIVYAQTSDLTGNGWVTTAPANAAVLLKYASILVARACQRDPYTDQPSSTEAPVLNDATCAQVASWVALGVDPAMAGTDMPGPVKSSSILDGTIARDTTAAVQAQADARDGLCALATDLLQTAGLLYVPVPAGDDYGWLPSWGLDTPIVEYGYGSRAFGYDPNDYEPVQITGPVTVIDQPETDTPNIRAATGDFAAAAGDEVWVDVPDGITVTGTLLVEPAGQHVRVKRIDQSTGHLVIVGVAGALIDGQSSFQMGPLDAYEFDSDGTNFAIF